MSITPDPTPTEDPTGAAAPVQTLPGDVTTVTVPLPPAVNLDLLRAQVQADPVIAGAGFRSFNKGVADDGSPALILGLTGDTTGLDLLATLNAVIAAHDPDQLTPEQIRAQREEAARARLEAQALANHIDDPNLAILDILIVQGYGKVITGPTP